MKVLGVQRPLLQSEKNKLDTYMEAISMNILAWRKNSSGSSLQREEPWAFGVQRDKESSIPPVQCYDFRQALQHQSSVQPQSTVVVEKSIQDLMSLMQDLSAYSNQFLEMVCDRLKEYKEICNTAYRGIVQCEEKLTISASWSKDEDISRLLQSLPNWANMAQPRQTRQKREDEEDFTRAAFAKESEVLTGNLGDKLIPQNEILRDVSDLKALANLHESMEWLAGRLKTFFANLPHASSASPSSADSQVGESERSREQILQTLSDLSRGFQDIADRCLLVLHLEVRVHCFHYLIPLTKQGNYAIVANVESMDYDPLVVKLNKDISAIEEAMGAALQQHKFQYIFEGLGHLISCILINGAQYFKRISESGIKKMCRNIFVLQQNLTNITMSREADLDFARSPEIVHCSGVLLGGAGHVTLQAFWKYPMEKPKIAVISCTVDQAVWRLP
ncbi:exocyst complex component 4 isoform X2 [Lates japonicus]|uniref:Exocyst complex component Sec8 n=1 Tax=Lates japonicus TaxID=270547 RepID=A0AAD3NIC2_LATJO|nr:exocyst complex component 4 isoform X2 [Lates japonicus]